MRLTARQTLSGIIAFVLLMLAVGTWEVINSLPDEAPGEYGVANVGLVAGAAAMGVLVVLLLRLLIAWPSTAKQATEVEEVPSQQPNLRWYWAVMVGLGWAGTFLTIIGIARGWQWTDILIGAAILFMACGAAYRIARRLYSYD
jgi:hypothetical protein